MCAGADSLCPTGSSLLVLVGAETAAGEKSWSILFVPAAGHWLPLPGWQGGLAWAANGLWAVVTAGKDRGVQRPRYC